MSKSFHRGFDHKNELYFTFKNVAVALLAGNAVLYTGNPEQWILDTVLMSELLDAEAERFAEEKGKTEEEKGEQNDDE